MARYYTVPFKKELQRYRQIKMNMGEDHFPDDERTIDEIFLYLNEKRGTSLTEDNYPSSLGIVFRMIIDKDVPEKDTASAKEALTHLYKSIKQAIFYNVPANKGDFIYPLKLLPSGDIMVELRRNAGGAISFSEEVSNGPFGHIGDFM